MDLSDFDRLPRELNLDTEENKLRINALVGHWSLGRFADPLILNDRLQLVWDNFVKMNELLGASVVEYETYGELFQKNFFEVIDEPDWIVVEVLQPQADDRLYPENWYVVDLKELILNFNQAIGITPEFIMSLFGIDSKNLHD